MYLYTHEYRYDMFWEFYGSLPQPKGEGYVIIFFF